MGAQRGSSVEEVPEVMKNLKTLVSTVLCPKWTFFFFAMYCLVS